MANWWASELCRLMLQSAGLKCLSRGIWSCHGETLTHFNTAVSQSGALYTFIFNEQMERVTSVYKTSLVSHGIFCLVVFIGRPPKHSSTLFFLYESRKFVIGWNVHNNVWLPYAFINKIIIYFKYTFHQRQVNRRLQIKVRGSVRFHRIWQCGKMSECVLTWFCLMHWKRSHANSVGLFRFRY